MHCRDTWNSAGHARDGGPGVGEQTGQIESGNPAVGDDQAPGAEAELDVRLAAGRDRPDGLDRAGRRSAG